MKLRKLHVKRKGSRRNYCAEAKTSAQRGHETGATTFLREHVTPP
jgi:hypothetical protein